MFQYHSIEILCFSEIWKYRAWKTRLLVPHWPGKIAYPDRLKTESTNTCHRAEDIDWCLLSPEMQHVTLFCSAFFDTKLFPSV